jgi:hypothetical protein
MKQVDALTQNINVLKKKEKCTILSFSKWQVAINDLMRSCCVFKPLFISYWVSPILMNSSVFGLLWLIVQKTGLETKTFLCYWGQM